MNITKQRLQQLAGIIPLNEITIKPIKSTKLDRWVKSNFEKIYKNNFDVNLIVNFEEAIEEQRLNNNNFIL